MSDKDKILKWFKTHKFLTVYQAVHKLGVSDPRSRISELSNVAIDHFDTKVKKDGKTARFAVYALV